MSESDQFFQMLSRAQELRDSSFRADTEFRLYLVEFEAAGLHETAGFTTFSALIVKHRLGTPEGHDAFKKGLATMTAAKARVIGTHAIVHAGAIKDAVKRKMFIDSAAKRVEDEGFPISEERARHLHQQCEPQTDFEPKNLKRASREGARIAELEAIVETLRVENRALKTEVARLTKQARRSMSKGAVGAAP